MKCAICQHNITELTKKHVNLIHNFVTLMRRLKQDKEAYRTRELCYPCLFDIYEDTISDIPPVSNQPKPITSHTTHEIINLDPSSAEYTKIKDHFMSTSIKTLRVIRIEKNINACLLQEYAKISGKEKLLFHGSPNDNYDNILKEGFKISKAEMDYLEKAYILRTIRVILWDIHRL